MLHPAQRNGVLEVIGAFIEGVIALVKTVALKIEGILQFAGGLFADDLRLPHSAGLAEASLSPAEFSKSRLFHVHYRYMGLWQVLLFCAACFFYYTLMHIRNENRPAPQPADGFQWAGYFILVVLWLLIYFQSRRALSILGVNRFVAQVAFRGIGAVRELYDRGEARKAINEIETLIPMNLHAPGMQLLLVQVVRDAKNWRFDSVHNLVRLYQRDMDNTTQGVENLQKLALRLGVLGSFVGLMLSIGQLPALVEKPDLSKFLPAFIGPLYLKFGCSIAGILAALYAYWMTYLVNREQGRYFREMEMTAAAFIDLASRSTNTQGFLNQFDQLRSRLRELDEKFVIQNQRLENLAVPLSMLGNFHEDADKYLRGLTESQERFFRGMAGLLNTLEMKRVFETFEDHTKRLAERNQQAFAELLRSGIENHVHETRRQQSETALEIQKLRSAVGSVAGPVTRGVVIISLVCIATVLAILYLVRSGVFVAARIPQ